MRSWNRIALGGVIAAVSVGLSGGCAEPESADGVRAAVYGGAPSTFSGAGMMACASGSFRGGVFLSNRHFLFVENGVPCPAEGTGIFLGHPGDGELVARVVANHRTPASLAYGGEGPVNLVISVLMDEADIGPATFAATSPVVDDELTVVGYGADPYDENVRTDGAFRVSAVAEDGTDFTLEPVGDVRLCVGDSTILDDGGELVGLAVHGTPDPAVGNCFAATTAQDLLPHRAWIDGILAMPMPDPPVVDSGAGDAAIPGDTSTEPPPTTDDGGCTVGGRGAGDGGGEPLAVFLTVGLLAWRRRRR